MKRLILAIAASVASTTAIAGGADGTWRTESGENGGYLEVTIGPCESDAAKTCGTISRAFNAQGLDPGYENLGKLMIDRMETEDGVSYSGGTIWDPEEDKTYKSKMKAEGSQLDVEGCIAFICQGQNWTRVE
jgi:uncharacterized protein (DUF2147 family)